jgi:hypothetical protein
VQQEVSRRVSQRATPTPEELSRLGNAEEGRITSRDANRTTNRTATGRTTTTRTATERTTTTQTPTRQTAPATQRTSTSRTEETNYYGGSIGQPVRVERQMRESSGERRTTETRSNTITTRSSGSETPTRSTSGGRR